MVPGEGARSLIYFKRFQVIYDRKKKNAFMCFSPVVTLTSFSTENPALKYNTTHYGLFPSLSMFRTLSPCQGLLTRDQPDLIWTPHTDWKYSISQDPSHIHQTQTSGLPIVRLAVLSQHGSLLVCHNCLGRQQLLHIGTSTNMFVPEPLYFSSIRSICNILEFHEG